jgi:hypothetical protein
MAAPEFRKIENTDGLCIVIGNKNPQTGKVTESLQPFMRADLERQLASAEAMVTKWQQALTFLGEAPVEEAPAE